MTYYLKLEHGKLQVAGVHFITLSWLQEHATRSGRGTLDMVSLPGITAYFDFEQADGAQPACRIYEGKRSVEVSGPVVFVCWEAEDRHEATVKVAEIIEILAPMGQPAPFIHPLHPTRQ